MLAALHDAGEVVFSSVQRYVLLDPSARRGWLAVDLASLPETGEVLAGGRLQLSKDMVRLGEEQLSLEAGVRAHKS